MSHLFSSADPKGLPRQLARPAPSDAAAGIRVKSVQRFSPSAVPAPVVDEPASLRPPDARADAVEHAPIDERDDDPTEITHPWTREARTEQAGARSLRALRNAAAVPAVEDEPRRERSGWLRAWWRGRA